MELAKAIISVIDQLLQDANPEPNRGLQTDLPEIQARIVVKRDPDREEAREVWDRNDIGSSLLMVLGEYQVGEGLIVLVDYFESLHCKFQLVHNTQHGVTLRFTYLGCNYRFRMENINQTLN